MFEIWSEFHELQFAVSKRIFLCIFFDEKIEGVIGGHVGDHFNFYAQLASFLGENQSGQIVTESILLPVDKMIFRFDFKGIGMNRGAAVGRRS